MHEPTAAERSQIRHKRPPGDRDCTLKKRTLEIRCLGKIEGGIPPPRVTWVIRSTYNMKCKET